MSGTYNQWPLGGGGGGGSGTVGSGIAQLIAFTLGTIDGQAAAVTGASITSASLWMQSATSTMPGLVSSATQTWGGSKTFTTPPTFSSLNAGQVLYTASNSQVANIQYTAAATNLTLAFRDVNGNSTSNNWVSATTTTPVSSGNTQILITSASTRIQKIVGSFSLTITLPDATTLYSGQLFEINNNTTQSLSIVDIGSNSITTAVAGSYGKLICTSNATVNGGWDVHWEAPSSVRWGTTGLPATNILGSTTAAYSMGALDGASASQNAGTIGSSSLYLQSASATNPGIVSSAAQTFGGTKTFNSQIIATGGVGLGATGTLDIGTDTNTQVIALGSTSVSGGQYYPRIGLAMNAPQASIHWGGNAGNSNTTSGTVGSFSIVLGSMHPTNALGAGAVIIGGNTAGTLTASGQGAIAIGDGSTRATGSFAVAIGDGALAQVQGGVAIGTGANAQLQNNAVSIGNNSDSQGFGSTALGNTVVAFTHSQCAVGAFNIVSTGNSAAVGTTDEVFVVGIGTGSSNKANALACTRDGGIRFYTSSGTSYVAIYAGTTTSYSVTLPGTAPVAGQSMVIGSTGNLGWQYPLGPIANQTATYSIATTDGTITVSSGTSIVKLPRGENCAGQTFRIKKMFKSSEAITILTTGTQSFDNALNTLNLDLNGENIWLQSNGSTTGLNTWSTLDWYVPPVNLTTSTLTIGTAYTLNQINCIVSKVFSLSGSVSWFADLNADITAATSGLSFVPNIGSGSFIWGNGTNFQAMTGINLSNTGINLYARTNGDSTFQYIATASAVLTHFAISGYIQIVKPATAL